MPKVSIGIALSGGIDSAVAAVLLLEAGYRVRGFFMELPLPDAAANLSQAEAMAAALGIPLSLLDLRSDFNKLVIHYFTGSYRSGLTPNPCIYCNQQIKFGLLAQAMLQSGMNCIATGHYARINRTARGPRLKRGADPVKDQSYFLARLGREQLAQAVLPLGEWHKSEVRLLAQKKGLPLPKSDSQDVCFLKQGLASFLTDQGFAATPGEIVDANGKKLGLHQGIGHYTIGQRRGLGLPDASPWYVQAINAEKNQLIVGKEHSLWRQTCPVHSLRWTLEAAPSSWQGVIQLRSQHQGALGELHMTGPDTAEISFAEAQRAIAPGQFAVFYQGDTVQGSAIIGTPPASRRLNQHNALRTTAVPAT